MSTQDPSQTASLRDRNGGGQTNTSSNQSSNGTTPKSSQGIQPAKKATLEKAKQWVLELDDFIQDNVTSELVKIFNKWTAYHTKGVQLKKQKNNSDYVARSAHWKFELRAQSGDVKQLEEFKKLQAETAGIVQKATSDVSAKIVEVVVLERNNILQLIIRSYASVLHTILKSFLLSKAGRSDETSIHQYMMDFIANHSGFITRSFDGKVTMKLFLTEYRNKFQLKELPRPLTKPTFIDDCMKRDPMFFGDTAPPTGTNPYLRLGTPTTNNSRLISQGGTPATNNSTSTSSDTTHAAIVDLQSGNPTRSRPSAPSPSTSRFTVKLDIKDDNNNRIIPSEYSNDIEARIKSLVSKFRVVATPPSSDSAENVDTVDDDDSSEKYVSILRTIKKNAPLPDEDAFNLNPEDEEAALTATAEAERNATAVPHPQGPTAFQKSINNYMKVQVDRLVTSLFDVFKKAEKMKEIREAHVEAFTKNEEEKTKNLATELLENETTADRPTLNSLIDKKMAPMKDRMMRMDSQNQTLNKKYNQTERENKRLRDELNALKSQQKSDSDKKQKQDPKNEASGRVPTPTLNNQTGKRGRRRGAKRGRNLNEEGTSPSTNNSGKSKKRRNGTQNSKSKSKSKRGRN